MKTFTIAEKEFQYGPGSILTIESGDDERGWVSTEYNLDIHAPGQAFLAYTIANPVQGKQKRLKLNGKVILGK